MAKRARPAGAAIEQKMKLTIGLQDAPIISSVETAVDDLLQALELSDVLLSNREHRSVASPSRAKRVAVTS